MFADWSAFPFLLSQQAHVTQIQGRWLDWSQYDLAADWQTFLSETQGKDDYARLRQFKQSRLAYHAVMDMSEPWRSHLKAMHRVTELADHLVQQAAKMTHDAMRGRYEPLMDEDGQEVTLMIFALGKMGSGELNYASDIDLVFLYDAERLPGPEAKSAAERYFLRFSKRLIRLLDQFTTDGQVYPIDMRLRPFGSSGPLVLSGQALVQYLQTEGREWERFAWMRARQVWGSQAAGERLLAEIRPFMYRRHLDYQVFDSLAQIKAEIAAQHLDLSNNLKLGPGGIRAIEFIVQSLQLVFGGRQKQLQGVAMAPQFERLEAANKLAVAQPLYEAWLWLRRVENLCQVVAGRAAHSLPDDEQTLTSIAKAFGLENAQALSEQTQQHRQVAQQMFAELFEADELDPAWEPVNQNEVLAAISQLSLRRANPETREYVRQLITHTLLEHGESAVELVLPLLQSILTRPAYLLMLLREPALYQQVLLLLQKHPFFGEQLTRYPALLELMFDPQEIGFQSESELVRAFDGHALESEQWMESLRYFKLKQQFTWVWAWCDGRFSDAELKHQFSVLARAIVDLVVERSWQECMGSQSGITADQMVVVAYGSVAMNQMRLTSDLDLVFILDENTDLDAESRTLVQRWIRRIMHHLSSTMYHGQLYEIDMQLRPNGRSGALVTNLPAYANYQMQDAWTWEQAALVKARVIRGNPEQVAWFNDLREAVLTCERNPKTVKEDLAQMLEKLQQHDPESRRGDEFILLEAVLNHAHDHPEICEFDDLGQLAEKLLGLGLIVSGYDEKEKDPIT